MKHLGLWVNIPNLNASDSEIVVLTTQSLELQMFNLDDWMVSSWVKSFNMHITLLVENS